MIRTLIESFLPYVNTLVFIYSLMIVLSYILMGGLSMVALIRYKRQNRQTDYNLLYNAGPLAPGITVIASCYNESASIVECVRALLNLRYNNYEVIVVNDGSTDDTFQKLLNEFQLYPCSYSLNSKIPTRRVREIYRSHSKSFFHLVVVDKENGGKADAMNAGINIASHLYMTCVDVDSILTQDALMKLIKPVMEGGKQQIVSVGGVVHVANGCRFEQGILVERRVSNHWLVQMQIVEYLRAFLVGRMAWGRINGLMLVSGALGLFRKDYVIAVGGYRRDSIGEDLELTMRMRAYLYEHHIPHKVCYVPEPLLWTEVPTSLKTLQRQRTRWSRGLTDSLRCHRNLLFRPQYGVLGMVSYPFFLFFEWLAPWIEALGLIFFVLLVLLGMVQWKIYFFLFLFIYLFGLSFSFLGIFYSELTYPVYEKKREMGKLFLISLTEAFTYHPYLIYCSLKGYWMYLRGEKSWGNMSHKGFSS